MTLDSLKYHYFTVLFTSLLLLLIILLLLLSLSLSLSLLLSFLLLLLFGQRPSLIYPRTFTILPSATSTTPSLHVRICQDGDYHKVLIAPFALILNHSFMLSLAVNSILIALPGDKTQSLTSSPIHFNLHSSLCRC